MLIALIERARIAIGLGLRGHVTCRGKPLRDVRVTHGSNSTRSREDGSFVLVTRDDSPWFRVEDGRRSRELAVDQYADGMFVDGVDVDVSCDRPE